MAGCGWFPSPLLLVYLLELYRLGHILYILYFIYLLCLMFGLIQSSGTNLYLPCYLQQTSHDSKSITPQQQQGALSHINVFIKEQLFIYPCILLTDLPMIANQTMTSHSKTKI